jgi:hypothetical protein
VVECDLAKVEVAGSNPVSRSRFRAPFLKAFLLYPHLYPQSLLSETCAQGSPPVPFSPSGEGARTAGASLGVRPAQHPLVHLKLGSALGQQCRQVRSEIFMTTL